MSFEQSSAQGIMTMNHSHLETSSFQQESFDLNLFPSQIQPSRKKRNQSRKNSNHPRRESQDLLSPIEIQESHHLNPSSLRKQNRDRLRLNSNVNRSVHQYHR